MVSYCMFCLFLFAGLSALTSAAGGLNTAVLGGGGGAPNLQSYQNQSNLGGGNIGQQSAGSQAALGALSNLGLGNLGGLGNLLAGNQSAGNVLQGALPGFNSMQGSFGGASATTNTFGMSGVQGVANLGSNYTAGQQLSNYSITGARSSNSGYQQDLRQQPQQQQSTQSFGGGYSGGDLSSGSVAKTRVFVRNVSIEL